MHGKNFAIYSSNRTEITLICSPHYRARSFSVKWALLSRAAAGTLWGWLQRDLTEICEMPTGGKIRGGITESPKILWWDHGSNANASQWYSSSVVQSRIPGHCFVNFKQNNPNPFRWVRVSSLDGLVSTSVTSVVPSRNFRWFRDATTDFELRARGHFTDFCETRLSWRTNHFDRFPYTSFL